MSFTKELQTMAVKRNLLYKQLLKHVTCIKRNRKGQKVQFFNQFGAAIFTHSHTYINKSCWQSAEIIFEAGNIASQGKCYILGVFLVFLFVIFIWTTWDTEKEKLSYRNIDTAKFWLRDVTLLAAPYPPCVNFSHFFFSTQSDVLFKWVSC